MIYSEWMSYIKDEVKLKETVMPGAHNAGSFGMMPMACCQDGNLKEQFEYGIRHYCLRMCTDKKTGRPVFCHGLTRGRPVEGEIAKLAQAMNEHPTEFFILDIREYQPQKIGPLTLKYHVDAAEVDRILSKYLNPAGNALTDFSDIGEVTMGDIRRSGKRFLLLN